MKTNTHFRNTLTITFIILSFGSCRNNNLEDNIFNFEYDKFHGKYKIIKSTTNEAIDVDLDGAKSNDLLKEIPTLPNSILELRIYKGGYMFNQSWQEPFFSKAIESFPTNYTPENKLLGYNSQGELHTFEFTLDYKTIKVIRSKTSGSTDYKWTLPESVNVVGDELIEIITNRKMYTSDGIKMIKITSLYKRYQKST